MGIDELKARLDSLLRDFTRPGSSRDQAAALHSALVDMKVGLKDLEQALGATERELTGERSELETAERRGQLARDIDDGETASIADQFVTRHRERVALLERKLAVQQEELAISRREYEELAARYRGARQGIPEPGVRAAMPDPLAEDELLQAQADRQTADAAVEAQLAMLKKKLGKQ